MLRRNIATHKLLQRKTFSWGWLTVSEVHYRHGGKHGSVQAGVVLEKQLRVLQLNQQAAKETVSLDVAWA